MFSYILEQNRALIGAEKELGPGWCPAAGTHFGFQSQGTITTGGTYETTYRLAYRNMTGKALDAVRIGFANCYTSGTGEAANGNSILVRATVQKKGSSVSVESNYRYDLTASGSITMTVEDRGFLLSDELPIRLEPNEVFYVYVTQTTPSNGGKYPIGGCVFGDVQDFGIANGEGVASGNTTRNGSSATAANNGGGSRVMRPAIVLGHCVDNVAVASCFLLGDSKTEGANDMAIGRNNYGGFASRLCKFDQSTGGVAFSNVGCTGHTASAVAGTDGMATRLKFAKYFSHAMVAFEYNDRGGSLATLKTKNLAIVNTLRMLGLKVFICTSFPGSVATTDGYQTVASQTPDSNSNRTGWNTHLDDLTATGFLALSDKFFTDLGLSAANYGWCKVLDLAAGIEVNVSGVATRNGGYVKAPTINTAFTTTSAGSTSTAIISALGAAWMQYAGYLLYWSGGGANKFDIIRCNGSSVIAPVNTIQLENTLSNSITSGQTVQVYNGMLQRDTIHPASGGHIAIAAGCQTVFDAGMAS